MSSERSKREGLMDMINDCARRSSTITVLFHQAVAERLGLNATEHKCMDVISRCGLITAGQLAEITGLTTGAITGIIDRLEKAGMVRRERDPNDRRRVILQMTITPEREQQYRDLFEPLARATRALCEEYTNEQLEVLLDFFERSSTMVQKMTKVLRGG
jgi:DNA-binding MarR family transcriptional regulator